MQLTKSLGVTLFSEDYQLHNRQQQIWDTLLKSEINETELNELDLFINNTSIRMRLSYNLQSIELPGDVDSQCWQQHEIAPCTIVKLPHHGHRNSFTEKLINMLKACYAVISVSNTRTDNCPSEEVINLLSQYGTEVLFTDAVCIDNSSALYHNSIRFTIDDTGKVEL